MYIGQQSAMVTVIHFHFPVHGFCVCVYRFSSMCACPSDIEQSESVFSSEMKCTVRECGMTSLERFSLRTCVSITHCVTKMCPGLVLCFMSAVCSR